jgi:hypothetical protein
MKRSTIYILLLALFAIVFCINNFATASFIEKYYQHGLYKIIRVVYNHTLAYSPIPIYYFVLLILLYGLYRFVKLIYKKVKSKQYCDLGILLSCVIATVYISFYVLWAFNYKAHDLSHKLDLQSVDIDTTDISNEIYLVNKKLAVLRKNIGIDTMALDEKQRPIDIEKKLREAEKSLLNEWNQPHESTIRVRPVYPKGTLLIFSTAGIYIPFTFEGQYDAGLSHIQSTYVIAHEMGHGFGYTSEADCNFIALLTCMKSDNEYLQYTGLLTYWRYLMSELRDKAKYSFYFQYYNTPTGVKKDIKAIYKELDKYPDVMPILRDIIYDHYLKANGVGDGIMSYNKVIDMMFAWKHSGLNVDVYNKLYK